MKPSRLRFMAALAFVGLFGGVVSADVFNMPAGQTSLQFVTVGDPGNAADPLTGFGSVPYTYQMGEFDITAAQYVQFLNAVAQTDPYSLYNSSMTSLTGAQIFRSGSFGSYTYRITSTAPDAANFPINNVSWGDAARFANWLSNGEPTTGVENSTTTEDGSYALNGALTDNQLASVIRSPFATYVIPTENEWYKAAYYKGGSTHAGYWLYPTRSNTAPTSAFSLTGTNNANYLDPLLGSTAPMTGVTPVGLFAGSPGPYGTFDMGGDVEQWTEGMPAYVIRGGGFIGSNVDLLSSTHLNIVPSDDRDDVGFRIAEVPEPSSMCIVAMTLIPMLRCRRR